MLIKDLLEIPERIHQSEFVLKLTDGVARPEETLKDYVVTPRLVENFDDALSFVAKALEKRESRAAFLHGSFGSGKSHFMAVLHMLLNGLPAARTHVNLAPLLRKHKSLEGKKFLLLPFHMIGATSMESAILGGYVERVMTDFPGAPMPGVYLAAGLFADARAHLDVLGDEAFFGKLNEGSTAGKAGWGALARGRWNRESFEAAASARADDPQRLELIGVLLNTFFTSYAAVVRERSENFVSFDLGLSQISRHAAELRDPADGKPYDGLILFLDELVLWLASRAADLSFIHGEMDKVVKLFEAEHSNRPLPIITFAARQRDLRDLVGEHLSGSQAFNFSDSLKHQEGRFHVIELEDSNLPEIIARRILRPKHGPGDLEQLREAFERTRFREDVKEVLLTSRYTEQTFRSIYPFSPALVETLVAVSSLLQRNRTAIRILMELLVDQQDTLEVGQMIPVGDLFEYVSRSWEAYNRSLKDAYTAATNLLATRFRPALERTHPPDAQGNHPPAYATDLRLVHTILLAALFPQVEALRQLTPNRLAALNQGTIKVPPGGNPGSVVLSKLRQWQPDIGELRIEESTQVISLNLTSVDIESVLEKVRHEDSAPNRKRKVRELLFAWMGIRENTQGRFVEQHQVVWRGTSRTFEISYLNVREQNLADLAADPSVPRLIIDYPFDESGFHPSDDRARLAAYVDQFPDTRTTVWLPRFLAASSLRDLGRLVQVDYVLAGDRFETYTTHLSATDKPSARLQLDNVRTSLRARLQRALEMAYGILPVEPGYLAEDSHQLDLDEQFQSLHSKFQPRPPAAPDLAQGLNQLLCQELAAHYPAHPEFPVEREITAAQVRSLWSELQPAFEGSHRIAVEKSARDRFRQIAEPLKLGRMGEDHFLLEDHWKGHFQQELYKLGDPGRVSLRQLHQWTDEPRPMGLPPRLRNLVALVFAFQTNRNVVRGERLVEPLDPEQLTPDMELVPQDLPTPEEWETAHARAAQLLAKLGPMQRTVPNTNRLAARLRESLAAQREAVEVLPGELAELARALAVDPEAQPRLHTARLARALVELSDLSDPLLLVRGLAELPLTHPAAVFTAMEQARHQHQAFVKLSHGLTEALVQRAEQGHEGACDLVASVRAALAAEEIAVPLRPALDELSRRGPLLLVDPKPPVPPPPPVPGRRKLANKTLTGLSSSRCRKELEDLTALLAQEGVQVDLSWTVWKDKP